MLRVPGVRLLTERAGAELFASLGKHQFPQKAHGRTFFAGREGDSDVITGSKRFACPARRAPSRRGCWFRCPSW